MRKQYVLILHCYSIDNGATPLADELAKGAVVISATPIILSGRTDVIIYVLEKDFHEESNKDLYGFDFENCDYRLSYSLLPDNLELKSPFLESIDGRVVRWDASKKVYCFENTTFSMKKVLPEWCLATKKTGKQKP